MTSIEIAIQSVTDNLESVIEDLRVSSMEDKTMKQNVVAEITFLLLEEIENNDFFLLDNSLNFRVYNGVYYELVTKLAFEQLCQEVMRNLRLNPIYSLGVDKKLADTIARKLLFRKDRMFVPNREFAVFPNGVLNLTTLEFATEITSEPVHTDVVIDYDYDPSATDKQWDDFLNEVLPDLSVRGVLQEFCGATLVDRDKYKIESACYLIGRGANGKSVFVDVIGEALCKANVVRFDPEALFKSTDAKLNIAACDGKLLNIASDVSRTDISGGSYKKFVSGETMMARRHYGDPYDVSRIPLSIACVNEMPVTSDSTDGYTRRLLPIVFGTKIANPDTTLTYKLTQPKVKQAVLNWLIEGQQRFLSNGGKLTKSENIEVVKREVEADMNSVRRFISERGYVAAEENGQYKKLSSAIFNDYIQFCDDEHYKNKMTHHSFSKEMCTMGFKKKRYGEGQMFFIMDAGEAQLWGSGVNRVAIAESVDGLKEDALPF